MSTDPNSVLEVLHSDIDPALYETREDILFLRHGIIKEKCAYAPMPLLNTSPIDINQFESLREAHEIRNFNNLDHFQQSLKFIENLNSLSLKDQTEIDLEKEMQLKLDSTIRPCASAIDGVKPKWPKFLPVPLYKPAKPSQTVEPVSRRESAVRRTFRRIFSNHDASTADEYSPDELYYGPVVSMFTFYPTRGKKDISDEYAIKLSASALDELKNVHDYDSAFEFTNKFGSDFLVCEFFRHDLKYKMCHIISHDAEKIAQKSLAEESRVNDYLRRIAYNMITHGVSHEQNEVQQTSRSQLPTVHKMNNRSHNIETPLYETINLTRQWVPVWAIVKKYKEENKNSMPENAWIHLKDVWVFRTTCTQLKAKYFDEFRKNRAFDPKLINFDFDSYWNNTILDPVEFIYKESIGQLNGTNGSDTIYLDLMNVASRRINDTYYQDETLIYQLYTNNIFYLGKESNLEEFIQEMEKTHHSIVFLYNRKLRLKQVQLFNKMFDNFVYFIKTWNMTTQKPSQARKKHVGIVVDVNNHPTLIEKAPLLKTNFLIDQGFIPFCEHPNFEKTLKYSGFYLVSMADVDIAYSYKILDLSYNMFCLMNPIMACKFRTLESLDLSSNSIEYLQSSPFSQLDSLQTLNLSRNLLQFITRDSLTGLKNLKKLDLSSNRIDEIGRDAFNDLTELETLILASNSLDVLNNQDIAPFADKLISLDLSHNRIRIFPTLKTYNLKELYINDNQLDQLNPKMLDNLGNLEILNLSHNYFTRLVDRTFSDLHKLEVVFLNSNRITWIADSSFLYCGSLRFVSLADNRLVNLQPVVFEQTLSNHKVSSKSTIRVSALKSILLYGNLLNKHSYVYYWKESDTFEKSKFPKLKHIMMEYDHNKLFDITESKKFKNFKDQMRREIFRYGIENNIHMKNVVEINKIK